MTPAPPAFPSALEALVEAGDVRGCLDALRSLGDSERSRAGRTARKRLDALWKELHPRDSYMPSQDRAAWAKLEALQVIVLRSATPAQVIAAKEKLIVEPSLAVEVLRERPGPWIAEWLEALCANLEARGRFGALPRRALVWPLLRAVVRAGLAPMPSHPLAVFGVFGACAEFDPTDARTGWWAAAQNPFPLLERDPDFVANHLLRTVEEEGPRDWAPNQHDWAWTRQPWYLGGWGTAFVVLSRSGAIPRPQLISSCLVGLGRDFAQPRAVWVARLLKELDPTTAELVPHLDAILRQLESRVSATVTSALKMLLAIDKEHPIAADCAVPALAAVLEAREVGKIRDAYRLLERLAARASGDRARLVEAACVGLKHEKAEVQSLALDFVGKHAIDHHDAVAAVLAAQLPQLAPPQAQRARAWLGTISSGDARAHVESAGESDAAIAALRARARALPERLRALAGIDGALAALDDDHAPFPPPMPSDGTLVPRLDSSQRIEPVRDLDELIELCSRILEGVISLESFERALDGVSRLADQRPHDFAVRTAALGARVEASGDMALGGRLLAQCIGQWLARREVADEPGGLGSTVAQLLQGIRGLAPSVAAAIDPIAERLRLLAEAPPRLGFLHHRALEIGMRAATRRAAPLLALPTDAGGWIDPRVLVERIRKARDPRDFALIDCAQALLRLAPDGRDDALREAKALPSELGSALRYALGSDTEPIGPTAALWVAAARARAPFAADERVETAHPGLGPDAGMPACFEIRRRVLDSFRGATSTWCLDVAAAPMASKAASALLTVELATGRRTDEAFWMYAYGVDASVPILLKGVWPLARESFFANAVCDMRWHADVSGARANVPYLQPLFDADVPLRPMAAHALVLAAQAKDASTRVLARELLTVAIGDGRARGPELTGAMIALLPMMAPQRWTETLRATSASSALHRAVVADVLESVLGEADPAKPQPWLDAMELLHDSRWTRGEAISSDRARAFLSAIGGAGKAATRAKKLLALAPGAGSGERRQARIDALRGSVERVEAWLTRSYGAPSV